MNYRTLKVIYQSHIQSNYCRIQCIFAPYYRLKQIFKETWSSRALFLHAHKTSKIACVYRKANSKPSQSIITQKTDAETCKETINALCLAEKKCNNLVFRKDKEQARRDYCIL